MSGKITPFIIVGRTSVIEEGLTIAYPNPNQYDVPTENIESRRLTVLTCDGLTFMYPNNIERSITASKRDEIISKSFIKEFLQK